MPKSLKDILEVTAKGILERNVTDEEFVQIVDIVSGFLTTLDRVRDPRLKEAEPLISLNTGKKNYE